MEYPDVRIYFDLVLSKLKKGTVMTFSKNQWLILEAQRLKGAERLAIIELNISITKLSVNQMPPPLFEDSHVCCRAAVI